MKAGEPAATASCSAAWESSRSVSRAARSAIRFALIGTGCIALLACGTFEPRADKVDNVSYLLLQAPPDRSSSITDVDQARRLLDGLMVVLSDGRDKRNQYQDAINEFVFYGILTAVVGIAAKSIAARNVGGGVAGIGSAVDGHYKLDQQSLAFAKAYTRAGCVLNALNVIDLQTYALFDGQPLGPAGTVNIDDEYSNIPNNTISAVQDIGKLLRNDLKSISTKSGSLSDIQKTATDIRAAAEAAATVPTQAASQSTQSLAASKVQDVVNSKQKRQQLDLAIAKGSVVKTNAFGDLGASPAEAQATLNKVIAFQEKAANEAVTAAASESARMTSFKKGVVQYAAAARACTAGP
jgi:hypothetical protein